MSIAVDGYQFVTNSKVVRWSSKTVIAALSSTSTNAPLQDWGLPEGQPADR